MLDGVLIEFHPSKFGAHKQRKRRPPTRSPLCFLRLYYAERVSYYVKKDVKMLDGVMNEFCLRGVAGLAEMWYNKLVDK